MQVASWIQELLEAIEGNVGERGRAAGVSLLDQAAELGLRVTRQEGHPSGTAAVPSVSVKGAEIGLYAIFEDGRLALQLDDMRRVNPFKIHEREEELRSRLARVEQLNMSKVDHPDLSLSDLHGARIEEIKQTIDWAVARIRGSNPN